MVALDESKTMEILIDLGSKLIYNMGKGKDHFLSFAVSDTVYVLLIQDFVRKNILGESGDQDKKDVAKYIPEQLIFQPLTVSLLQGLFSGLMRKDKKSIGSYVVDNFVVFFISGALQYLIETNKASSG